jgi:hypothetical protein
MGCRMRLQPLLAAVVILAASSTFVEQPPNGVIAPPSPPGSLAAQASGELERSARDAVPLKIPEKISVNVSRLPEPSGPSWTGSAVIAAICTAAVGLMAGIINIRMKAKYDSELQESRSKLDDASERLKEATAYAIQRTRRKSKLKSMR